MNEDSLHSKSEMPSTLIPWEERLEDHDAKLEEFLQNCVFRGCSVETTVRDRKATLKSIFRRITVPDSTRPSGYRHLLVWDLLNPILGSYYLSLIISSLLKDGVSPATQRKYMNCLRYLCEYVLAKPNLPGGNGLSVSDKYGPIAATFTKYDLPIHAADTPSRRRYALAPDLTGDFLEFLRMDYLPGHCLPHIGARNYTAIVLQVETGARSSELLGIRLGGESRDVNLSKGQVRLFGKGKAYSGKRLRWVPLTPLASEALEAFQNVFKPMFPKSADSDYLFLNEDGSRLATGWYYKTFRKIVKLARESGLSLPEDLRPHDLRRTYATNTLERDPLAYRKLLKHMGHSSPSSAAPYLIATDDDVEEEQSDLIDIFVDPHTDKKEKN